MRGGTSGTGSLWAETDAMECTVESTGTTTLHNDTRGVVYLPGREKYYYEKYVAGRWTDQGPELILCEWEGEAYPVNAGSTEDRAFGPFTHLGDGTWRIRYEVGHDCRARQPMNQDNCASLENVYTPAFVVTAETKCGDPVRKAAYAECSAATDKTTSVARGGSSGTLGLALCVCETGEEGGPCTRPSDCLTECLAPTGPDGLQDCDVIEGTCAARGPIVDCWCAFDDAGRASTACWDY